MLAIGRSLMGEPELLMLDEPSLGLAPRIVTQIFRTLIDLSRIGISISLVEQNVRLALEVGDYAYVLESGRNRLHGSAETTGRASSVSRRIACRASCVSRQAFCSAGIYSARGVALATALGWRVGQLLAEQLDDADLPVPVSALRKIPAQGLHVVAARFIQPWHSLLDRHA